VWRYITLEENVYSVTSRVIYDLLLVKSKRAEISVSSVSDVDCMIEYRSVCVSNIGMCVAIFISFLLSCVLLYDFHIK